MESLHRHEPAKATGIAGKVNTELRRMHTEALQDNARTTPSPTKTSRLLMIYRSCLLYFRR